ncbi:MAG: copper chaperone PCu(A)C, partial [Betaproteobacteria bacterium]
MYSRGALRRACGMTCCTAPFAQSGGTPMKFIAALLLACTFGSGAAAAHDYALKSLKIDHPFARATPPGAKVAGVFAAFENTGSQSDRLLSVSTPMAGVAELHEM